MSSLCGLPDERADGYRRCIQSDGDAPSIRRVQVPDRIVGGKVVLVRPGFDEALVLGGAAALVWVELDEWTTEVEVWASIAREHPGAAGAGHDAVARSLQMLDAEGLLEHRDH